MKKINDNEDVMGMSPCDFDQSVNGWRKYEARKEYLKAVELIREYIIKNIDKILGQKKSEKFTSLEIMYFHIGQLLASMGIEHWPEAIKEFEKTFHDGWECWNAYVSATIGYLEGNVEKIDNSINTIENSQEEDKRSGNLGIVRNFKKALEIGERDYEKIYLWPR